MKTTRRFIILAAASLILVPGSLQAQQARPAPKGPAPVDFFAARQQGLIDVKFIPRNSKQANVLIQNNTKQKLALKLPQAFAGVPVLAQFGGGGGMGGGGMGGGGMGGGGGQGGGGGGGFFNLEPNKMRRIKVMTVCLEHGKKEPSPRMEYDIVPIEWMTNKPEVIEICKMIGSGQLDQAAAQAATWHYTDNMSWQELAQKVGRIHLNGATEPYFLRQQMIWGFRVATVAQQRATYVRSQGTQQTESLRNE